MSENSVAEKKLIQLKDRNENLLYPKIALNSIDNGIIGKEKLNDEVKQKIDGIVITLNYSGHPMKYEVGESSLSSSSVIETYYNAYRQGVNIYFVISSGGKGNGFTMSSTYYLPVYEFSYKSNMGYTLRAKDDLFIYTANSIDESPYLTVTTSAITAEPKDFSVTTTKLTNKSVTKDKLSDDIIKKLDSSATDVNVQQLQTAITTLNGDSSVIGSVDKKVADAISALVGTAPNTLNTLQKIAQELQDPSKNTTTTVLDQVASKANSADLTAEISRAKKAETAASKAASDEATRAKAAEKTNADAIAANTISITNEVTRAQAAEKVNSDAIAAINAKLLSPMLTYEEVTE